MRLEEEEVARTTDLCLPLLKAKEKHVLVNHYSQPTKKNGIEGGGKKLVVINNEYTHKKKV